MPRCGLAFIPVSLVVIATLLIGITFPLAVANNDVAPFFPYLSFLGSKPPASIVFSYLLYASSLLGSYVRYRLVRLSTGDLSKHSRRLNIAGFVLGIAAGVGMSVVATVRITEVYTIHMLGAGLLFWPSAAYCILQTVLSYLMLTPQGGNGTVCRLRLVLSLMSSVSIFTCLISSILAAIGWSEVQHHVDDKQHWQELDGGYVAHLVSAFTELTMVLSFIFYFLTFIPEFRHVRLKVIFISHDGDDRCIMGNDREGLQCGRSYHFLSGEGSDEESTEINSKV
ncbi:DNA damage-regulated autophagy modulator protein 1-like isoform X2 [Patiria miniata]|uniref:CWH43-like N-terminal domain-containing protein n=1 Tax=Patiria miniata TaxID=46514 RepID=A0A913Z705_PATMI|nr:DNA damage-regulated autophagy modulator protein 1-like isoform X2 [Patiria miniata]